MAVVMAPPMHPVASQCLPHARHCSIPSRAIQHRLQTAVEIPSWVGYLPTAAAAKEECVANSGPTNSNWPTTTQPRGCAVSDASRAQAPLMSGDARDSVHKPPLDSCRSPALAVPTGAVTEQAKRKRSAFASSNLSVWKRSRDAKGCREVQAALEQAASDKIRITIALELRGHIWEAMQCPHANHVLQKCIMCIPPEACQFIIDELISRGGGAVTQAARHRYGCRILERLLEHCLPCQVSEIVDELMTDVIGLCSHPYGNYVVQHMLEHGVDDVQERLSGLLGQNALAIGSDGYATAVLAKALQHGSLDVRVALARSALKTRGLLAAMARTRYGHVAVKLVLQLFDNAPDEHATACRELQAEVGNLRSSRYGRAVAACLDEQPCHQEEHLVAAVA